MNDWYQRMLATLQLNGKGEPTQKAYTRAVRMLSEFYDKTPDLVSESARTAPVAPSRRCQAAVRPPPWSSADPP